ncbi:MAG: hypothetical protein V4725_18715 [Bacteroidota bacterium]
MRKSTSPLFILGLVTILFTYFSSCSNRQQASETTMTNKQELDIIDSLLKDGAFMRSMAETLDAGYYKGIKQDPPPFLSPEEERGTIVKPVRDEKIATNLAGFYALECGVSMVSVRTGEKPLSVVEKVMNNEVDSADKLLFNRFANATWKAGQPFRGLDRISRETFMGAHNLSNEEVKKDEVQVRNAARKLLLALQPLRDKPAEEQREKIRSLLQDSSFAYEMASWLDSCYYAGQGQTAPPFLSVEEQTATINKKAADVKIATNVAGFYALETAVNYLATTRKVLPSSLMRSLIENTLSNEDRLVFARFANATWKASQPFRGLERIRREIFVPFDFLDDDEVDKDINQVRNAAVVVLPRLQQSSPKKDLKTE